MKLNIAAFYPASTTNYTRGRTQPIRRITVHHSAGWEQTLRYLWADPNRNGSSHFWVGNKAGHIEQYVDTNNTAWTNGNLYSNHESITIEVRGDWRGYYDQTTLNNLGKLILELRKNYPNVSINYHKDVSDRVTLCPAELKDKGYAKVVWDGVTKQLNPPAPTPAPAKITYKPITPKRIKLKTVANLWNFNFTDWAKAKAVQAYGKGHLVDVVAVATNSLGGKYYMTAYSYNNGNIRVTNGFNINDCEDYKPAITQPPTVAPKWESMKTPRKMRLAVDSRVTDLDKMQESGDVIKAGADIDLVELKTTAPGKVYARSKWSRDNNKNWGILLDRFIEVPAPTPEPPREPVPEPPIDVDPTTPGSGDPVLENTNQILKILKAIANFFGIKWE